MACLGVTMKYLFSFLLSTALLAQIPIVDGSKLTPTMGPSIQRGPGWTNALKNLLPSRSFHGNSLSFIMTFVAPTGDCNIEDSMDIPMGWKSYQFEVPARQTVTFKLDTEYKSNFRLFTVNRWGDLEEGMLQNTIYKGEPKASYISPKDTPNKIYLVIASDDFTPGEKYTLEVRYRANK